MDKESSEEDKLEHHRSGLRYRVVRKGSGKFHPAPDALCECHYSVTLKDGTEIDSSYARGQPKTFSPDEVIEGWATAMQLMVEGDKWYVVIPDSLAYGREGSPPNIPGNAQLILTIEIIKIIGDKVPAERCDVFTKEDCGEREKKWINRIEEKFGKNHTEYVMEHVRLSKIQRGKKLKPKPKKWLTKRINLLIQFLEKLPREPRPPPVTAMEEPLGTSTSASKEGQQEEPVAEKEEVLDLESGLDKEEPVAPNEEPIAHKEEPIAPNEEMQDNEPTSDKEEL